MIIESKKETVEAFTTKLPVTPEAWAFTLAEACNAAMKAGAHADKDTFLDVVKAIQKQALSHQQAAVVHHGHDVNIGSGQIEVE